MMKSDVPESHLSFNYLQNQRVRNPKGVKNMKLAGAVLTVYSQYNSPHPLHRTSMCLSTVQCHRQSFVALDFCFGMTLLFIK